MPNITKPSNINETWASTGDVVAPSVSKIQQGWIVEAPPRQTFNWLDNRQDVMLAYLNQKGIPEWDSVTEYQANKSYVQGSNGAIYKCIQTGTNQNPLTQPLYWTTAFDGAGNSYSKSESDARYAIRANNLSDLTNIATARNNLDVYSRTEGDTRYLQRANNLSDVGNVATARTNLGIQSVTDSDNKYLQRTNNLSDVNNVATARTNLSVYSKSESDSLFVEESQVSVTATNNSIVRRTASGGINAVAVTATTVTTTGDITSSANGNFNKAYRVSSDAAYANNEYVTYEHVTGRLGSYTNVYPSFNGNVTMAHAGGLLMRLSGSGVANLPLASSVPDGTTFTFMRSSASTGFAINRTGSDSIANKAGNLFTAINLEPNHTMQVVKRATGTWQIVIDEKPVPFVYTGIIFAAGRYIDSTSTTVGGGNMTITRINTGEYSVVFTNMAPVNNYVVTALGAGISSGIGAIVSVYDTTTSGFTVKTNRYTGGGSSVLVDVAELHVQVTI